VKVNLAVALPPVLSSIIKGAALSSSISSTNDEEEAEEKDGEQPRRAAYVNKSPDACPSQDIAPGFLPEGEGKGTSTSSWLGWRREGRTCECVIKGIEMRWKCESQW
jgi:hypothetical protein